MANYGAGLNPFGNYDGYAVMSGGKYYNQANSFFSPMKGSRQLDVTTKGTGFSDFERQWYIDKGFGDPLATKTEFYNAQGKLIKDGLIEGRTPVIKGQGGRSYTTDLNALYGGGLDKVSGRGGPFAAPAGWGVKMKQVTKGVSPEARQLYLMATGGVEPTTISDGTKVGQETIVAQGRQGIGTIQSVIQDRIVPMLEDPNYGARQALSIARRIRTR